MTSFDIRRTLQVADLEVGTKRLVTAYAAVFDTVVRIRDQHGEYWESIGRSAFDVTLRNNAQAVKAIVNHGADLYGQPTARFALPYGTVTSMVPDGRGLLTVTRVAETPLGDEILELMRSGALTGFSFAGSVLQTTTVDPVRSGDLPTLIRTEIKLREFGPAVFPAYESAQLLDVRSGRPLALTDDTDPSALEADGSTSSPADDSPANRSESDRPEQGNDSTPDAAVRQPNAAQQWLRDQFREDT